MIRNCNGAELESKHAEGIWTDHMYKILGDQNHDCRDPLAVAAGATPHHEDQAPILGGSYAAQ